MATAIVTAKINRNSQSLFIYLNAGGCYGGVFMVVVDVILVFVMIW